MRSLLASLMLITMVLAGCASSEGPASTGDGQDLPLVNDPLNLTALVAQAQSLGLPAITLAESVVDAAVDVTGDLYEPTMEVCDDGSIYITGHTIAVDTTGAPVFGSHDDGESWGQLPFTRDLYMPEPVHGATPPITDEIYLSCGDDGWLYGADITLASFPVNGWNGYGTEHAYYNPNAYDEGAVATSMASDGNQGCVPGPVKDRPWGAYANGSYLLVNNPASGPAQIGVLQMPPALPYGVGATVGGASWNLCAGVGSTPASSSIPGVPALRDDGFFVVPQRSGNGGSGTLHLITGNVADIMDVDVQDLFDYSTGGEITSVYGHAVFDAEGTLFVGITDNGAPVNGTRAGGWKLAASTDDAETFQVLEFTTPQGKPIVHSWIDANEWGPGALLIWVTEGDEPGTYDWYMGHLLLDATGAPSIQNASLVIDDGLRPSAHVTGGALGPDGRAYTAMYTTGAGTPLSPTTPLSVYIQRDGPTMDVSMALPDVLA